jgi:hypothetical protein
MSQFICFSLKKELYLLHTNLLSAMQSHPHSTPESVLATGTSASIVTATVCPILAAAKTRAKALKKWRKQERLRFFSSLCASFHALGFSF